LIDEKVQALYHQKAEAFDRHTKGDDIHKRELVHSNTLQHKLPDEIVAAVDDGICKKAANNAIGN